MEEQEEELDPDQGDGKEGGPSRVKTVLVRQLGTGSQTGGQGHRKCGNRDI